MNLRPFLGIGGQQRRQRVPFLKVTRDGAGVGDHGVSVNKYGDLPLSGQPEDIDLTHTRDHLNHAVAEGFGLKHQANLQTKG